VSTVGDVPPPLTARITVALNELRLARDGDPSSELMRESWLNRLLDTHIKLKQAFGTFKPLAVLDPELDARLSVVPRIRLVGNPLLEGGEAR
jgi:hypothetical protein